MTQKIPLRRFQRQTRVFAISYNYFKYLHDSEIDLKIEMIQFHLIQFHFDKIFNYSDNWIDHMKDNLKTMKKNKVYDLVKLLEDYKRVEFFYPTFFHSYLLFFFRKI